MKIYSILLLTLVTATSVLFAKDNQPPKNFRALVFSKTLLYRHASITNGIAAIKKLGEEYQFKVDATEDSSAFTSENLAKYKVVVFLSTSGDVLNDEQQTAFQKFIEGGGGFVGIHAAAFGGSATEAKWPWYGELLCASFTKHSAILPADVVMEDRENISMRHFPPRWKHTDEWYNFTATPRPKVHVLASVDETTYHGGTMEKDHPVVWCKNAGKGRMWYTALGHTDACYAEPFS